MVRRLLRKLKRDDDLEAIVEFTYILMKIYFTERPDFIQKAVRLGRFMLLILCLISFYGALPNLQLSMHASVAVMGASTTTILATRDSWLSWRNMSKSTKTMV